MNMNDLVGTWEVPLYDKIHKIQFEHGTTTGRRVLWIDNDIILKKEWMFKLVGSEPFEIKNPDSDEVYAKCEIVINACLGFTYEYILYVNGKQFKTFREKQSKIMRAWHFDLNNDNHNDDGNDNKQEKKQFRVVLEKDTLDVWVNGQKKDTTHEFGDSEGTEIKFNLDEQQQNCGCIKTISSGDKRKGMIYVLEVNGQSVNEKDVE